MNNIKIIGNGYYLPKRKIENSYFFNKMNINDEYIYKRSGIKTRYFVEDETIEEMAIIASRKAIENAKINENDIDMIIVATTSSDRMMPGISYKIQKELKINECICLDILAGCGGFINALDIARNYISLNKIKKAIIVGVDILSKCFKENDLSVGFILSDGAGAIIVENSEKEYYSYIISDGKNGDILTYISGEDIYMDGTKVYKYAVKETVENIRKLLKNANIELNEIKYIVPHQSNAKIMNAIANRLGIETDKMLSNIENVGNTFCASIPIAINKLFEKKDLKSGDKIILLGYGGGLNTGSILLEI